MGVKWYLVVLSCVPLVTNDVKHLFMSLLASGMSFLGKLLLRHFAHFSLDCLLLI